MATWNCRGKGAVIFFAVSTAYRGQGGVGACYGAAPFWQSSYALPYIPWPARPCRVPPAFCTGGSPPAASRRQWRAPSSRHPTARRAAEHTIVGSRGG
eukprot:scaffold268930_cov33-Tisochrysis_lutea.AAC.2